MGKNKKIILTLILLLLIPLYGSAEKSEKKAIIFSVDSISFDQIEQLELENYGIGLFNIKSRKPYDEENFFRSINIGRKISKNELDDDLELEYMGDILREENPIYMGNKDSKINLLISDSDDSGKGIRNINYNMDWLDKKIDHLSQESNLIALDYEILNKKERIEILSELIIRNQDKLIYIIPREVNDNDKMIINKYLVPIIKLEGDKGVLKSNSTKRSGIIALEDISFDIRKCFEKENVSSIGKSIEVEKESENLKEIEYIYEQSIKLIYISYIYHGLLYLSQGLLLIFILTGKIKKLAISFFVFATNHIWISLIISLIEIQNNLLIYLILASIINIPITMGMLKNKRYIEGSIILTYLLIVLGVLFKPGLIYNSYIGYNNLIYGARFYGFNNGIAAVLLATSIFTIMKTDKCIKNKKLGKFIIAIIPIVNLISLSAKFGANTGSFISAILLLLLVYYNYFIQGKINLKAIIVFTLIGITIFAINIYYDSISLDKSHAVQFIERIRLNGLGEIYYMASFKLKELVKLTIMPPFPFVLICQFIILKKLFVKKYRGVQIMLIVSLLGFIINDTGNILLVYMLNYLILILLIENDGYLQDSIVKLENRVYEIGGKV